MAKRELNLPSENTGKYLYKVFNKMEHLWYYLQYAKDNIPYGIWVEDTTCGYGDLTPITIDELEKSIQESYLLCKEIDMNNKEVLQDIKKFSKYAYKELKEQLVDERDKSTPKQKKTKGDKSTPKKKKTTKKEKESKEIAKVVKADSSKSAKPSTTTTTKKKKKASKKKNNTSSEMRAAIRLAASLDTAVKSIVIAGPKSNVTISAINKLLELLCAKGLTISEALDLWEGIKKFDILPKSCSITIKAAINNNYLLTIKDT